ncbi:hypothetical protein CBS9595_003997 [Malassezia furfur]|nr:hypothetical protein CBS9595_003997 [Malassezia furfur]
MSISAVQSVPSRSAAEKGAAPQPSRPFFADEVEELGDEELGEDVDLGVGQYADAFRGSSADEYTLSESLQQSTWLDAHTEAVPPVHTRTMAAAQTAIPEPVRKYLVLFHQAIVSHSMPDMIHAYESHWNRLTEKYYQRTEWPDAETIAPLVGDDATFLMLYRELWYRHVYSRLMPDGEDRFQSYDNYCDLFNYILNSDGPVPLELPVQWLWDMIDEFIYQFQSYSQWRNKVHAKSEHDLQLLQDGGVWSAYNVLNVLYSLIQKSRITEQLIASDAGEEPEAVAGAFGARPLYKTLGYFSLIGLLRVHVLLGDYTLALKTLDHLHLHQKNGFLNRVTACHVTAYYYVGFAYMMLRRYPDAIRAFSHILVFVMRLRQYHTRNYQYDQINKMSDRMYALLAMCCALCPTRLDENVASAMREKYGEQYAKMTQGGDDALHAYQELFLYACPKFLTCNPPPYHDADALKAYAQAPPLDPVQHQLRLFLAAVQTQRSNVSIRAFLRLYTALGTDKLASFLEVDEEEVLEMLMVLKSSTRSVKWTAGGLLEGEVVRTSDLQFAIDADMVQIAEARIGRRYGDWFVRNASRMHDVLVALRRKPLPVP